MKELNTNEYKLFLKEVIKNIENAKIQASYQLNAILVELNYRNGKLIIEKQEKYGWGSSVIKQLAKELPAKIKEFLPTIDELNAELTDNIANKNVDYRNGQ